MYLVVFLFCKASWLSRRPGAKIHEKRKLRFQGRMQSFEQISQNALNLVLILPDYRTHKMVHIPLKIIDLQMICDIAKENQIPVVVDNTFSTW